MTDRLVYLVTRGAYSDYSVLTAFSTEDMANRFVEQYNKAHERDYYAKAEVEECGLDCPPDKWAWQYVTLTEAGEVQRIELVVSADDYAPGPCFLYPFPVCLRVTVLGDDAQRAVKAAHEKWAAIKAAVPWGDNKALDLLCDAKGAPRDG